MEASLKKIILKLKPWRIHGVLCGPHAMCATETTNRYGAYDNNFMHVAYMPGFYIRWGIEVSDSAK